jgi:hypothetical protein
MRRARGFSPFLTAWAAELEGYDMTELWCEGVVLILERPLNSGRHPVEDVWT